MKIKVNVKVLHKNIGDIIEEGDKVFETFKTWAENGDRARGAIICEIINESIIPIVEEDVTAETGKDIITDEKPEADEDVPVNETQIEGGAETLMDVASGNIVDAAELVESIIASEESISQIITEASAPAQGIKILDEPVVDPLQCPHCDYTGKSPAGLGSHIYHKHPEINKTSKVDSE